MRKVEMPETVVIDEKNQKIRGVFLSIEESYIYPGSYAVKYTDDNDKKKVVFVNGMGHTLFESADIKPGDIFELVFKGMEKSKNSDNEYKTFELFVDESE